VCLLSLMLLVVLVLLVLLPTALPSRTVAANVEPALHDLVNHEGDAHLVVDMVRSRTERACWDGLCCPGGGSSSVSWNRQRTGGFEVESE